jgi:hypothetical protein
MGILEERIIIEQDLWEWSGCMGVEAPASAKGWLSVGVYPP